MATSIKKKSPLNRIFSKRAAANSSSSTGNTFPFSAAVAAPGGAAGANGNGGGGAIPAIIKKKNKKEMKWETHRERINGYFFCLDDEAGGAPTDGQEGVYYCFVGIFKNAVVIHLRVYIESNWGDLIPTKV